MTGGFVALMAWIVRRRYRFAEHIVTPDRIVRFSGIIGRDYSSAPWAQVQDLEINVGLMDWVFGTGTVSFQVAGSNDESGTDFAYLSEPYSILNDLEETRACAQGSGAQPSRASPVP